MVSVAATRLSWIGASPSFSWKAAASSILRSPEISSHRNFLSGILSFLKPGKQLEDEVAVTCTVEVC